MAKVVRNIEITEEEAQVLVKACSLVNDLTNELSMTLASFFDKIDDMCLYNNVSTGQGLNGKFITDDYSDYEIKIVDK